MQVSMKLVQMLTCWFVTASRSEFENEWRWVSPISLHSSCSLVLWLVLLRSSALSPLCLSSSHLTSAGKMNWRLCTFSLSRWLPPCLPTPFLPNIDTLCQAGMKVSSVWSGWHVELPDIQQRDATRLRGQQHLLQHSFPSFTHSCYSISGAILGCFLMVPSSKRSPALHAWDQLCWQPMGLQPCGISSLH